MPSLISTRIAQGQTLLVHLFGLAWFFLRRLESQYFHRRLLENSLIYQNCLPKSLDSQLALSLAILLILRHSEEHSSVEPFLLAFDPATVG
jgi:hypothetical protein